MKDFKIELIIFLGLMLFTSATLVATIGTTAIDIQLHDTYFVLDKISMVILITGPLMFLAFLARAWVKKFKSIYSNIGLIIGLMLVAFITYRVIQIQESDLNYVVQRVIPGNGDNFYTEQFIAEANLLITRGFLVCWIVSLIVLIFRTIKILLTKS